MAGFSYKTSWLAVRDRTPEEVADALALHHRQALDWATGTDLAYEHGVYVAGPVRGWTLAHGRLHLRPGAEAAEPAIPSWLEALSRQLGEVQFFVNERVPDYHVWARARDGEVLRAYSYLGMTGEVLLFVGEPTADEIERNVATRVREPGSELWSDDEWDEWHDQTPRESDVMAMASRWSINPGTIDDDEMTAPGIHGLPPSVPAAPR